MANYRQFRLANIDNTDSIELNDFNGYLATMPSGLGIYMNNSYLNVGSKRIKTRQENSYKEITMIVDIYANKREDVEKKYVALRNFLVKYREQGFRLYYSVLNGQERYIVCDIKTADKGEKSRVSMLSLPLIIDVRSYWKTDVQSVSTVQEIDEQNLFIFTEDEDYTTGSVVNVAQTIVGSGSLTETITSLANIDFEVTIDNEYKVHFVNTDFEEVSHNLFRCVKTYKRVNVGSIFSLLYAQYRIKCEINLTSGSITFETYKDTPTRTNGLTGTVTFNADSIHYSRSVADASIYDETVAISVEPRKATRLKGGSAKTMLLAVGIGDTEVSSTVALEDGSSYLIKSISYSGLKTSYTATSEAATMVILGNIYYGNQDNHVVGFLEDEIGSGVYQYDVAFVSAASIYNNIKNDGDTEIPLKIRVYGPCTNPVITLFDKSNNVVQSSKVVGDIPATAYLEINSDAEDTGVWAVNKSTGVRTNMMSSIDQTTNVFITLPIGEYVISAVDANNDPVPTTVFFANEYVGA